MIGYNFDRLAVVADINKCIIKYPHLEKDKDK